MIALVCELEGKVAGFTKLTEFTVGQLRCGLILWIAVHPNYRRKGIALELTHASVECLKQRGVLAVFASTQRRNKGALAVLGEAEFRQIGFFRLYHFFGWRVFSFYGDIWFAPGEVVLMCSLSPDFKY